MNILVSGAGIAGCVTAYFLAQAGHKVTVIERAPLPRAGGQNVDIRGHGLTVLRRMGVEDAIRAKMTHEKGLRFVDAHNRSWADFPVGQGDSFTGEIEIMRGDLATILYERTKTEADFVFGESIESLQEDDNGVHVSFENGLPARRFDVVIAADGWASRTRSLAFGPEISEDAIKSLHQWTAWCTVSADTSDAHWARWYNATGRRMVLLRPDNAQISRASLWIMPDDDRFEKAFRAGSEEQKSLWARSFDDAGWESKRVVKAMLRAHDFYMQKIAQVKMSTWSKGQVVLVGDAGYCPSPITGMGTTLAIVGSYILAGELVRRPSDPQLAFAAYDDKLRPFVNIAQKLAPGAPGMANPRSQWGITVLYTFLGIVTWVQRLVSFGASFNPPASAMELPEYKFTFSRA